MFDFSYITDQLISTIPFRVYAQLTTLLARDKINIAGRLFNLTLEEAMSLRDSAEHGCLSMDADEGEACQSWPTCASIEGNAEI